MHWISVPAYAYIATLLIRYLGEAVGVQFAANERVSIRVRVMITVMLMVGS